MRKEEIMKRTRIAARLMAFVLVASLITVDALPVFAAGAEASKNVIENFSDETSGELIYVDDALYSGYYMDSAGIFYIVTEGKAIPVNGMVNGKTKYYRCDHTGAVSPMVLSRQTVFVAGKAYSGCCTDAGGRMFTVTNGIAKPKNGIMGKGSRYFSCDAGRMLTLPKQTLYVGGKRYTGHYLDRANKMYSVKNGISSLQTGTIKKGGKYYSDKAKKTKRLAKETLYVKGKVFAGYCLTRANKMYQVKRGSRTLKEGLLKKGARYYSYKSKKVRSLKKDTIYVNGKAMKGMSQASMKTLQRAQAVVARVTNDRMTKQQKLKACFDFVKTYRECNPRLPHYKGMDWPVIYANDMFVNGTGNCCSYGAAFAYMAKAVGYEEVYCCNSGGHGWAEIDGLVYDPEWSIHFHYHSYYALSYNTRTDQNYKGAIAAGLPWMHVKI